MDCRQQTEGGWRGAREWGAVAAMTTREWQRPVEQADFGHEDDPRRKGEEAVHMLMGDEILRDAILQRALGYASEHRSAGGAAGIGV